MEFDIIFDMLLIVWLHFFADFIFQSDEVAINKGKCNKTLLFHVIIYSLPFLLFGIIYAVVNGILHFITDYVSARVTSYFHKNDQRHMFFVTIGFDQAFHVTTLILTYYWLIL